MRPTETLKEEHKAIKLMLRILEKVCIKLESGERIDQEHLDKILEFIRVFSDKCHHGKEENLLFPAIEKTGIPREGGPTGMMIIEHNMGRDYVKGMKESVAEYKAGDHKVSSKIIENARNYISLLTQHIEKGDSILYPIADMQLSDEEQKRLLDEFERVENEIVGAGKHEEFHKLLNRLKEIYLNNP